MNGCDAGRGKLADGAGNVDRVPEPVVSVRNEGILTVCWIRFAFSTISVKVITPTSGCPIFETDDPFPVIETRSNPT